jgi:glutathione S-transferase
MFCASVEYVSHHCVSHSADKATTTKVIPAAGTVERYAVIGALSYISSEVHGNFAHLFNPSLDPIVQTYARGNLDRKLKYVNDVLVGEKTFVVGDSFTVADSYLYIALSWAGYVNVDLSPFPNVVRYYDGIKAMESVQAAHERMATSPSTTL